MMMKPLLMAGLCAVSCLTPGSAVGQLPQKFFDVVAVTGCLAQQGGVWWLSNASGTLATGAAAAKIGVNEARKAPAGQERYHVIGVLEEYRVSEHAGHRMLAKGLLIEDAKEKRLNLTSLLMVDQACQAR